MADFIYMLQRTGGTMESVSDTEGLYQKGSIPVRTFVNQIIEVIEQKGRSEEKDK